MAVPNGINPTETYREEIIFSSLPYEPQRVALDCGHSILYVMQNYEEQPPFCGLCFFRLGFESELPTRIHVSVNPRYSTLAVNGNPEMAPKFFSHLLLVMGLKPPRSGENLNRFRASRARGQYTKPAPRLFPVASALWKLMGYQPPLGIVLVAAVGGRTEVEIARLHDLSVWNVHQRMVKAIHTAMGYIPDGRSSSGEEGATGSSTPERQDGDLGAGGGNRSN